jgi:low temperature requirement protein LtrA
LLGETVLTMGNTFADQPFELQRLLALVIGFTGTVALWWCYFQRNEQIGAQATETPEGARAVGWWGTWTLTLIILGLIAIAVADDMAIANPGDDATLGFTILTFGGPALFLLAQLVFLDQALGHNGPVAVVGTGGARGPRGRHRATDADRRGCGGDRDARRGRHRRHRPRERSHPTAGLFAARSAGC